LKLKELISIDEYSHKNVINEEAEITGIALDSRRVRPGFIFFAFTGTNTDGHQFIEKAIENGAIAVVFTNPHFIFPQQYEVSWVYVPDGRKVLAQAADRFYQHPSLQMKIIGVTGTNGKTTTCFFLRNIFEENGTACGLMTTPKNIIGPDIFEALNTTEESLQIHALLRDMLDKGIQQAVLEVSSHGLALGRVNEILFDTAVVTNVVAEHLEFHKSFDNYFLCKRKLIERVEENHQKRFPRLIVINGDDENCRRLVARSGIPVLTYGLKPENDITAENIEYSLRKTSFRLKTPWGNIDVDIALPGQYNVYNALAAATPALYHGISKEMVAQALVTTHHVPGRWEVVDSGQDFTVIVDFAHNWHGLENTLSFLKRIVPGKVITVFGCGGERDRNKRPLMGETVARWSDVCIVTSDNPRNEDPLQTAQDAMEGIRRCGNSHNIQACIILDRREAIRKAFSDAQPGDVVFLAGKGPERYQVYHDKTIHHNDYDVALEILRERFS